MMRTIAVRGVLFTEREKDGDFKYMSARAEHANSVFIVGENYLDMLFNTKDGGGTAAIRTKTWPNTDGPCAVGIPTGWSQESGGFRMLLPVVRKLIDAGIDRVVAHLIKFPHVNEVIYSADIADQSKLGVGIFKSTLSDDVRDYLTTAVHDIPNRFAKVATNPALQKTTEQIREEEITMKEVPAFLFAQVVHESARLARIASDAQKKLKTLTTNKSKMRPSASAPPVKRPKMF